MTEPANTYISAIVTAFDRPAQTVDTLKRIRSCPPSPRELLVHVDAGQTACRDAIVASGLADRVFMSDERVGPGGGRNLLVRETSCPIVASFDDDSWPLDTDYFARLAVLFARYPEAAVISATVFEQGQSPTGAIDHAKWCADFSGGGCAYRRDAFLATGGYVPLPMAYGMEEVDVALRLAAAGRPILHSSLLRVRHDSDLSRHAAAAITTASLLNIGLLVYLRYPVSLWWVGVLQYLNRVKWLLLNGRWKGIAAGIFSVPRHLRAHRALRQPLPAQAIQDYLALRRRPRIVADC